MPNSKPHTDWERIYGMLQGSNHDGRDEAAQVISRVILGKLRSSKVPDQERHDLCNQAWVRLMKNLPLRCPKALGAFVLMIAYCVAIDWRKKNRRRPGDRPGDDADEAERQPPNNPRDPSLKFDVDQALEMLTDEERAAFLMVAAGLTYKEGADALGFTPIKFKRRFYAARDKLRSLLSEYRRQERKKGS